MGFIFVPMIIVGLLFSFGFYLSALYTRSVNGKSQNDLWKGTILTVSITFFLMLLFTAVSSSVGLSDIFMVILLSSTAGLVLSLLFNKNYKNKHNERGKFNRTTGITVGMLIFSFLLFGISSDSQDVENSTDTEGELVEATVDEVNEEEAEVEAEKKAEEEKAAEEAEAEKKAEEEKAAEEAEAEQKVEEEKAAEEAEAEKKAEEEKAAEEAEKDTVKDGFIPVDLYRVVDGDTVHVIDENGEGLNLRLLLIDTPETVHPNEPVQPYGPEASARLTDLLNNAEQLYIEYDEGEKRDHYERELVYLYADDINVHEVLLEEGLARVGYIYEQQRYLEDFRAAEQYAKDNQLGIWSISGYVNEGGEGFNYEEEPTVVEEPSSNSSEAESETSNSSPQSGSSENYNFANCTELREVFPDGVMSDHPAYQSKMDRDNDGHACE